MNTYNAASRMYHHRGVRAVLVCRVYAAAADAHCAPPPRLRAHIHAYVLPHLGLDTPVPAYLIVPRIFLVGLVGSLTDAQARACAHAVVAARLR